MSPNAFGELEAQSRPVQPAAAALTNGGDVNGTGVPGGSSAVEADLARRHRTVEKTDANAERLLKEEEPDRLGAAVAIINAKPARTCSTLRADRHPAKLQGGASAREIATANQVVMLTRIARTPTRLQVATRSTRTPPSCSARDTNTFRNSSNSSKVRR